MYDRVTIVKILGQHAKALSRLRATRRRKEAIRRLTQLIISLNNDWSPEWMGLQKIPRDRRFKVAKLYGHQYDYYTFIPLRAFSARRGKINGESGLIFLYSSKNDEYLIEAFTITR